MASRFFGTASFMGRGVFEAPLPKQEELSCSKCKRKKAMTTTLVSNAQLEEGGYNALRGANLSADDEVGCPSCKRRKRRDWTLFEPSNNRELMGAKPHCPVHMGQTCPISPPPTGLNCQLTSTGDIICSNNVIYADGCPLAPPVNYAGVAQDLNGVPVAPPPPGAGAAPETPAGSLPSGSRPAVSPLAIGAGVLVAAGIAYAIFK